jgi:hypothetical protein
VNRTAARLRALPLAVLVTIVVAAVAARVRTKPPRAESTETTSARSPALAASGLDARLVAPTPAPTLDASVPRGAPRMIHGGPSHAHRGPARGPRSAKVGFRVSVGGPVAAQITASPDEKTLYAATLEGSVVALAREDGAKRWSVSLGDRVYSTPLVADDGTVYVGTDAKKLVALGAGGATLWRLELAGEADTGPVFAKDGTIVVAAGRDVVSVRKGGDVAWTYSAKDKVFTSPAITADGLVIVGSQDDHVYAIGPGGTLAWAVDLGADVDGAAAIGDDGSIYVGTDAGDVVKLGPKGQLAWRTPVGGFVRGVLSVARNGDVLAGTYGPVPRVVRLSPDGAVRGALAIRGTGAREFGIHGGPLEDEAGVLYFGAQDDVVRAIGPDGAELFHFETKGDVDAPISMLTDGSLVIGSEDGTVTLLLP